MYDFWYDYVKPNYGETAKLCYMGTDRISYIIIEDIYVGIAEDVATRFDSSNYELERPLTRGKNKKVIGLMKDELRGKIMKEVARFKAKLYCYLTNNNVKDKN